MTSFDTVYQQFSAHLEQTQSVQSNENDQFEQQLAARLSNTVRRVIVSTESSIRNMDIVKDLPRDVYTTQPGEITSFSGIFPSQKPSEIEVDQSTSVVEPLGMLPFLPLLLPFVPNFKTPVESPTQQYKQMPRQKSPASKPPSPKPPATTVKQKSPAPAKQSDTKIQSNNNTKQTSPDKKKTESKPKTSTVPVELPEKRPKINTPVEPKPLVIPEESPKPKKPPVVKPPVGVPKIIPKEPPVSKKPEIKLKQMNPQVFDYFFEKQTPSKQPEFNRLQSRTDQALARYYSKPNATPSNPTVSQRITTPGKTKIKTPAGKLYSINPLAGYTPFVLMSELIEHVRHGQVHDEQKQQVMNTVEFNEAFVDHMQQNPITDSEIMTAQMKSTGANKAGAITSPETEQQSVDKILATRRAKFFQSFYDDVFMPRVEKQYMINLMRKPDRDGIDESALEVLRRKYPEYYEQNKRSTDLPAIGDEQPNLGPQAMIHDDIIESINQLATNTTNNTTVDRSPQTTLVDIVDRYDQTVSPFTVAT